jgi:hypothetical protein
VAGVRDRETGRRDWMDREKLRRAWGRSRLTRAREAGGGGGGGGGGGPAGRVKRGAYGGGGGGEAGG